MMRRRLANNLFFLALVLVSLFTLCYGIYEYQREHAFRCDILHAQMQLNNYTRSDSTIRLTIIDTHGEVLYDSKEKHPEKMGNHLERKEVSEALLHGSGYDIKRTSDTNGEKYFYSATYFPDSGIIVRSAVPYSAPLTNSLEEDYTYLYYTVGILALIAIVLYLRYRLNHSEQEKQRIKRQLTENAAHELKTPAATIEGYLETLVSNPTLPKEKREEFIGRCYAQSRRMSQLLTDMSTLTRLDEAQIMRPATTIDASQIIRKILEETASQFEERGIDVSINLPESLPMHGDASIIYSLFHNIFTNTLAHATNATRFDITSKTTREHYQFVMSDNGTGVPAESQSLIFERFYRIDKGRSRRLGGTGLGLAIVKNIALQYGGTATAHTTPGGGLTIEISIEPFCESI